MKCAPMDPATHEPKETMNPLIDVATLAAHRDDPEWIVFDCRHDLAAPEAGEMLYRTSHLPHARFAHLDRDLSGSKTGRNGRHPLPSKETLARYLVDAGVNRRSTLVAYDASNSLYASRFWWLARWLGHAQVAVLDGGFATWLAAGQPVTPEVPTTGPGDFAIGPALVTTADVDDVEANLATQSRTVVDARAPERYRGEVEPLDPVAGHIPHAVNRPMARNLEADGRFKSAAALRDDYEALLAGRSPDRLIHSCGSGVTACHQALAMEIAGLPGAAIYPGSWSEWCADPSRPVARGED